MYCCQSINQPIDYNLNKIKLELFTNKATNKANYFITCMNTYHCSEIKK